MDLFDKVFPLCERKGQFVLFNGASRTNWFSCHWLLDVKHTYFFRENPLSP